MFLNRWQKELNEVSAGLLTIPEAAQYLDIPLAEIEALLENGLLRYFTVKEYQFVSIGSLEQYLMEKRGKAMTTDSFNNPLENPFKGVNPILQALFQIPEIDLKHKGFQTFYITYLSQLLNQQLRGSHYFAIPEGSIRVAGREVYPDVVVKGTESELEFSNAGVVSPDLVIELPRIEVGILIGQMDEHGDKMRPVTAIELLSPTNLDRSSRIDEFNAKHQQLLAHGLNVVTVHFLHSLPPTLEDIPRYPADPDAAPYHLTVTRPHEVSIHEQYQTYVYRFGLDTAIPTIALPLIGEEKIAVNFDQPYQETFINGRFNQQIDYATLSPSILGKFREADRHYLEQRLAEISRMYTL